jgi:hypothetical protein
MDAPVALVETVARPLSAGFERLAGRRGDEAVHRRGLVVGGRLRMWPESRPTGAVLVDGDRTYSGQARLSWELGPVGPLPDVAGLGLRVVDADGDGGRQDLLVDSSLPPPRDRLLVLRRRSRGGGRCRMAACSAEARTQADYPLTGPPSRSATSSPRARTWTLA